MAKMKLRDIDVNSPGYSFGATRKASDLEAEVAAKHWMMRCRCLPGVQLMHPLDVLETDHDPDCGLIRAATKWLNPTR